MISVPRVATHIVLSSCLHKVQIVVVTSIDMLRVNKSRLNMMFARKTNPLSKDCQFYCLDMYTDSVAMLYLLLFSPLVWQYQSQSFVISE